MTNDTLKTEYDDHFDEFFEEVKKNSYYDADKIKKA